MPNAFAYIALFSWPLVAFVLFRRFTLPVALIWTILGGYLFLPSLPTFDFPLIPVIDKNLIPAIMATILVFVYAGTKGATRTSRGSNNPSHQVPVDAALQRPAITWIVRTLIAGYVLVPFLTMATNPEPVVTGGAFIPGLHLKDAFSGTLRSLMALIPFLLARQYLFRESHHLDILRALCLGGIIYSFLVLFEARMSPQLNVNFYGYFPHGWAQHVRDGSWRAIVFLQHGLWVGVFLTMSVLAIATLVKQETGSTRAKFLIFLVWMVPVLFLSKNFGALIIGGLIAPLLLLGTIRTKIMVAAIISVVVMSYPILRGSNVIPVDTIHSYASSVSEQRADSLNVRLRNEDTLLAKAEQKPLFGWGGWGRSRVINPETGKDVSITDGMWVIVIGVSGWFGYLATFGLLCVPTILLAVRRRSDLTLATSGLALVLCANLIDLLPNATLTPITWLVAGAIAGFCERRPAENIPVVEEEPAESFSKLSPYARSQRPRTT